MQPFKDAGKSKVQHSVDDGLPAALPGIDCRSGLRRCHGDARLYRDLLVRFRDHYGNAATLLDELIATGRLDEARHLAHAVRGAAANLSMPELAAAAAALEQAITLRLDNRA
jgi:HPt (histidine-containing phosphotransfer) domain-containing protein